MQAGKLRQRLTLQTTAPAQDAHGQPIDSWSTLATVWAEIVPTRGYERFVSGAEQQQAVLTHRVRIRFRDDVTSLMRGLWETRILDIEEIKDPNGRRSDLVLMCREVMEEEEISAEYFLDFSDADMSMYIGVI